MDRTSSFLILKNAVGVAGNVFALALFVSPMPTFKRIVRNQSTEEFSGMPYIYTLLSSLITLWYGTPLVSNDNVPIVTVNTIGAAFQLLYIILFIIYSRNSKKSNMVICVGVVWGTFLVVAVTSLLIEDRTARWTFMGLISSFSLISMFASPLLIINLVIRTRSVEYMPFYLSLAIFLVSTCFCVYGCLNLDAFVFIPNGIGVLLGIAQLVIYSWYGQYSMESLNQSLIDA